MDKPLTTAAAAKLLRLDPSQVRRHCASGRIKAQRIGRDWLIPASEIKRFRADRPKPGRPFSK